MHIVDFPETRVASIEHVGPPSLDHETARKLIAWKLARKLLDQAAYRNYGIHYTDPLTTPPEKHRVVFCLSVNFEVEPNEFGILASVIPASRCALARDIGSRHNNRAAAHLWKEWLPSSGERPGEFPVFFHYVNVGPSVAPHEMVTDVYLPLA